MTRRMRYVSGLETEKTSNITWIMQKTRHVLFHVDQILINTKIIENRQEAITIISEVSELIENT